MPGAARRLEPGDHRTTSTRGFDALEVWIGDDRGQVYTNFLGQNAGDWFNLINQGIVRTGVADSDTHAKVDRQAGIPRTMVASPTDDPAALARDRRDAVAERQRRTRRSAPTARSCA